MKAKDLAALGTLGLAGYALANKFGGKEAPVKKKMGEGLEMSNQGAYERATVPKSANADVEMGTKGAYMPETPEYRTRGAYLDETPEYRTKGAYLDETPQFRTKGAYLDERDTPVAVASPVRTPVIQTRSLAAEQPVYDNDTPVVAQKPDATRVKQYNPDIMYNTTVASDPNVAHDDEMNRLARTRATRQGAVVPQSPNAQAQARILRQGATPAQSPVNAQAQARMLRQGAPGMQAAAPAAAPAVAPVTPQNRYTKDQYGNIIDNMTGKVSRTIFSAGQEGNAARNGMKRGGAVKKMASGGLTSSKMSAKPKQSTASSRGDGIAQRGKTRGMMR
jgi:hypothetical protein